MNFVEKCKLCDAYLMSKWGHVIDNKIENLEFREASVTGDTVLRDETCYTFHLKSTDCLLSCVACR